MKSPMRTSKRDRLELDVAVTDAWGVDAVSVVLTLSGKTLSAAAVSPRGIVLPDSAAPQGTIGITLDATLIVAGAVQEPALATLDAASAVGALTVARFSDGVRDWACKTTLLGGKVSSLAAVCKSAPIVKKGFRIYVQ